MKINAILTRVQRIIQDESYSRDDLLDLVNEGLGEIATRVVLPRLMTYASITIPTSGFTTSLPSDFFDHLLWAYNTTADRTVKVYHDLPWFLETYGELDEGGDCEALCEKGHTLYFQYVPSSAQTVRVWYSKDPTLFSADNADEITYIPKHLQPKLLINYAAKEIFSELEEGKDQTNFLKYSGRYDQGIGALIDFVGPPERAPQFIPNFDNPWGPHERTELSDI